MKVVIVTILIAFTSTALELNRFALDLSKKKKKPNVLYISNAFISAICGGVLSLTFTVVTDNFIIVIIAGILGTFIGVNSFKIVFKIFSIFFEFLKSDEFDEIFRSKK